jgi:nicotinate-nucleotide adenylyltransferase
MMRADDPFLPVTPMKTTQRIALFGGTFDPIHLGHTTVVTRACQPLAPDTVVFIPARRSPLKTSLPKATDADRVMMVDLAITGHPGWQVSDCELKRPAPSYTLDTIRHFRNLYGGDATLYWLIGADAIRELPNWHRVHEVLDLCTIVSMFRPGWPRPDFSSFVPLWGEGPVQRLQEHVIETPLVDVSSTLIRQRLAAGHDVAGMVHPKVLEYIRERGLYGVREVSR